MELKNADPYLLIPIITNSVQVTTILSAVSSRPTAFRNQTPSVRNHITLQLNVQSLEHMHPHLESK